MKTGKKACGCHISSIGHMPASVSFCLMHEQAEGLLRRARAALKPNTILCADIDAVLPKKGA